MRWEGQVARQVLCGAKLSERRGDRRCGGLFKGKAELAFGVYLSGARGSPFHLNVHPEDVGLARRPKPRKAGCPCGQALHA